MAEDARKVNQSEAQEAATFKAPPDYPSMARQLKIEGTVEVEAFITEAGTVEKTNIVSGNPILTRSVVEALKKWKFKPFLSDGRPIKAIAQLSFTFKL